MIGELLGGIADEFNSMSVDMSERRNRKILKGAYMMASTGATVAGWNGVLMAVQTPAMTLG